MIVQEYQKFILFCDSCYRELEFESFDEAIDYARQNHWTTKKVDREWNNFCNSCDGWEGED